jgi:putative zinc finger/helix-turn-helix YgiT family protein
MPRKNDLSAAKPAPVANMPFPRHCPECGKVEVQPATIPYDAEVKHDGRLYAFKIAALQVNKCAACGEVLFSNVTDDQISQALREHLALLSPQQIREALRALGLKQKDLGDRIGVAPETISRWISGTHIQSRAMDILMRLFFAFDNVRSALTESGPVQNLGVIVPSPVPSCGTLAKDAARVAAVPFAGRSLPQFATVARFSRNFSATVLRRKESFQLTPVLN